MSVLFPGWRGGIGDPRVRMGVRGRGGSGVGWGEVGEGFLGRGMDLAFQGTFPCLFTFREVNTTRPPTSSARERFAESTRTPPRRQPQHRVPDEPMPEPVRPRVRPRARPRYPARQPFGPDQNERRYTERAPQHRDFPPENEETRNSDYHANDRPVDGNGNGNSNEEGG
jgi:hypothetical protein